MDQIFKENRVVVLLTALSLLALLSVAIVPASMITPNKIGALTGGVCAGYYSSGGNYGNPNHGDRVFMTVAGVGLAVICCAGCFLVPVGTPFFIACA